MKKITFFAIMVFSGFFVMAQSDTTAIKPDTIQIGNMTIIKKKDHADNDFKWTKRKKRSQNIETAYMIMDFGFSNFTDKTDYASTDARNYAKATRLNEPAFTSSDFNLKNAKSTNFNLWFFMQRLNLVHHVLNLKYGLGIETNNYRFEKNISFKKEPQPYVFRDSIAFSKNKLALDYITVPFMVNINTNPNKEHSLSFSFGVSAGYLYGSRNKQKSEERGKLKNRGNYDFEKFKISYIAELGLGPIKLYGSYAPQNIFTRGLDFRPFNIGLRLGGWN